MFQIEDFKTAPLDNPHYVKPVRLNFVQNGANKTWEAVKSHDSVSVLLYHTQKRAFLLVKQFRAPVYMNDKAHDCTYELCAGIIDKEISLEEIVKEEIDEECGYEVNIKDIVKITSFFTNVGVTGSKQYLYFATIDASMKKHQGGGTEHEEIYLEFIALDNAKTFMFDEQKAKTPGLLFAFEWFFQNYLASSL
jgi:UDP-sugar diphosphatase